MRALIHALSIELFGTSLLLPDFPIVKSLRGLGTSDSPQYAGQLANIFDYRNTFYSSHPQLDVLAPPEESNLYDFVISSEVLEHVSPPCELAFDSLSRLLKPNGVLILTVPYSLDCNTVEAFPELHNFGVVRIGDQTVLLNRTRDGRYQIFDDLQFHVGCEGQALEMRQFAERDLKASLHAAGFSEVRVHGEDYLPFGILQATPCSLPITARKGHAGLSLDATCEILEQWRVLRALAKSFWVRLCFKLRLLP